MNRVKSLTRIYFPGAADAHAGAGCELRGEAAHYLARVLRTQPGAEVTLFDGRGSEYRATVVAVTRDAVELAIAGGAEVDRESPLAVQLAQGVSSGDRMDYTVQKAVELGAVRIQPLATERSVVHLDPQRAARRVAHWQAIAVAACAQCGRNRVPEIGALASYADWLAGVPQSDGPRLLLSPLAPRRLQELDRPEEPVWLLCGPEGGLSPREQVDARNAGFTSVRLGPRVLRTETAALAALAAMQALWGDF